MCVSKYDIFLYRVGTARGQPDLGPGQGRAGEGAGAQVSDVPLNDAPVTHTDPHRHSGRARERARMVQEVGHLAPSAVEVDVVRVGLGHVRQPSEETNGTAVDTPKDLLRPR